MSRQATCNRGGEMSLSELVDARVDRDLDEQRGSPLVRRDLGHPQRKTFLMRPKRPPSSVVGAIRLFAKVLLELLDQCALRFVEPARNVHAGMDVEVAAPSPLEGRHALAAQHVNLARLRAGRDLDLERSGRAGNRERGAERRLRHRQVDGGVEVVAVALDAGLGDDADLDEEVARRAGELSGVSLASDTDALPVVDSGGNVDVDRAVVQRAADAVAGGAR